MHEPTSAGDGSAPGREPAASGVRFGDWGDRYRTLFETLDEGFGVCEVLPGGHGARLDYRWLEANPRFEALTGMAREDVLGGRTMRQLAPELEEAWFQLLARVAGTGQPERVERYTPHLERWFDVNAVRIGPPDARRVAVLFRDVTERKRTEAALRESEERHRLIVEGARDYAIITTDSAGVIESWSPGAEAALGWAAAEAIGQLIDLTFVPGDRVAGEAERERREARESGSAPDVRWHQRKDGSRVFIEGVTRAITGPDGRVRGFLKVGQDVTRRREIEEALRESEARFRAVANLVPDLLWQSRPDGSTDWFNDRWYAYTGQTSEGAAGWGWTEAIHPDDRVRSAEAYARAVAESRGLHQEHRIRAADGSYRWFLVRAEPWIGPEGRVARWFAAATDVHDQRMALQEVERRVAERTAELAESNRALAAGIADRERAEAARSEVLRQLVTVEEDERRRISRELHDSVGQLVTGLMLGLRALEKGHEGDQRLADLERLADRIARELQDTATQLRPPALDSLGLAPALRSHLEEWSARSAITCDFHSSGMDVQHLPPELETTVYRVVQEGLTNVLKHAAATHVSLILERRRGMLSAIMEDDGRGFDVDAVLSAPEKARRLGLRGMRERVALLGGQLQIESAPEAGTTLFVRLPDPTQGSPES